MLLKSRNESEQLLLYRSLFLRMSLCEKDVTHYQHLEKGYAGELLFDQYVNSLMNEFLLLNDVLLDFGNNLFQMDSLAIFQDSVRKGIYCSHCYTFFNEGTDTKLICSCGTIESIDDSIIRSVREFLLLFPDRLVTTNAIYDWCGGVVRSKKTVRRVLSAQFVLKGHSRNAHFVLKS
ncbi:nuclease-related domain-containing protein [Robertmurraya korlensis]|uniref:nuclease-related domain-containing protein n=1 Tax=Robertmurraya korlensis TaxID=519977 RepID=UPI0008265D3D|nr:nuclease-related domain-containing protein [Robertmurraya korlensis]